MRSLIKVFASRLQLTILWMLSYLLSIVWSFSAKTEAAVYTCRNITLLEITCRGSYVSRDMFSEIKSQYNRHALCILQHFTAFYFSFTKNELHININVRLTVL